MSATLPAGADLYAPPDDATVNQAVADFARAVRKSYGPRVKGIYLFGSRARGDHTPESDADVAVVLSDKEWDYWRELFHLADLEYEIVVDTGADIQGWPVRESDWREPEVHVNPRLIAAMRRDARPVASSE